MEDSKSSRKDRRNAIRVGLTIAAITCGGMACAQKPTAESVTAVVQGGEYRIHTQAFAARQLSDTPVLVVALHGDAPRGKPNYHYRFAAAVAEQNADVVAVGLLRPGYTDSAGNKSDGVRGLTTGDNYNTRNTDSIAAAIGELERRWHARKVVVVGHSGGAAITANILGRHPAVIDAAMRRGEMACTHVSGAALARMAGQDRYALAHRWSIRHR